ncbi:MAG: hypothetical protein PUD64_05870 [Bacteroidales bacterium]|nr:hypothetical protein [Bacteroidales bacterium]
MSKYDDYIGKCIDWLNELLPQTVCLCDAPRAVLENVPIALSNSYDYFVGKILGVDSLFIAVKDMDDLTPKVLAKQMDRLKRITGLETVCLFENLQSYQASRLAKQGIDFICQDKQIFLPDFLVVFRKTSLASNKVGGEMPAFAQLIVLYHLQVASLNSLTSKELARKFQSSYATCNRSIQWLHNNGIVSLSGGKEKNVFFEQSGKALWTDTEKYMTSPIVHTITTSVLCDDDLVCSGERALSRYTMLDSDRNVVAVSKKHFNELKSKFIIDPYGEMTVEIWKYNPIFLMNDGVVDRLSLYLTLSSNQDERVSKEIETMIDEMQW